MMTNTPPNGAFRGFGAPQSQFAAEVHMDRIAAALGLDPIALRRKNLFRTGDVTATGQLLKDSRRCRRGARPRAGQPRARNATHGRGDRTRQKQPMVQPHRAARAPASRSSSTARGFTGGGEVRLASRAGLALTPDGVRLLVGSTEIGQGTRTMLAQIVADVARRSPTSGSQTADPDTAQRPRQRPDGGVAHLHGRRQDPAARRRASCAPSSATTDADKSFRKRARRLLAERGTVEVIEEYEKPGDIVWSDETYQGDAYGAYAWGCNIADVEIDPITYQARCTHFTAVIDIGKAIHPILAEGQIEGGTLQGDRLGALRRGGHARRRDGTTRS